LHYRGVFTWVIVWVLPVRIGEVVGLPARDGYSFIKAPTAEELLKILKGETLELRLEADIQLDAALQALQDGFSLTEIIQEAVWQLEKYVIVQILKSTHGNKAETARILKVDYKTLYRKIDRYFEKFPDFVPASSSESSRTSL
jgi:DNA-binding NtrC family response regulator